MMSEKNNNQNIGESAIARVKKRSMLKRQRLAIIVLSAVMVLLVASVFAVNYLIGIYVYPDADGTDYHIKKVDGEYALCYKNGDILDRSPDGYYITDLGTEIQIDPDTGAYSVVYRVDLDGTEALSYGTYVLMFKQLTYDAASTNDASRIIKSIEVHNSYNSYSFVRETNNYFNFTAEGYDQKIPYNTQSFAQLAVSCGYTVTSVRLENPILLSDGKIDYAEYGLADERRTRTETDENGNEVEVEYDYTPAWYVITTMSGDVHKVYIGDLTVTGDGYYAKYEGRDKIYVLSSGGFKDLMLGRIEKFISPQIVTASKQNDYFDVRDFRIFDSINHDGIIADFTSDIENGSLDIDFDNLEAEINKHYGNYLEKNSHTICHVTYENTIMRQGTLYAYAPYKSHIEKADGYQINSDTIDEALYALYDTSFTEVVKFNPSKEDLDAYGLYRPMYMILFYHRTTDSEGNNVEVENQIYVSEKNADGVFFAYSPGFNMIVGVNESSFGFLEYEELSWYENSYIRADISFIEEITIESPDVSVSFRIDDSVTKYMSYSERYGSTIKEGETVYEIAKNGNKYQLLTDGKAVKSVYEGDFLVTPLPYTPGVPEGEGYLFYETNLADTNGDKENDTVTWHIYNVYGTKGNYRLAAIKRLTDMEGNPISDEEVVHFEDRKSTEYFIKNNYIYLTKRESYIGRAIDEAYVNEEKYGNNPRGSWGSGYIYTTADGQSVLVNSETGEWSILTGTACGIHFADKDSSRLYSRALKIPEIIENGKIKRYGEVYYPTTANDLYFNEETGEIQIKNNKTQSLEKASNEDCTIGIWCRGAYYATEGKNLVVVNEESGDWGTLNVLASQNYVADIYADNKRLDYVIKTTNHVGKLVDTTAMENFQQFYGSLLYATFEGMADLSDEEKAELRLHDDFSTGENNCQLKITVKIADTYGNRHDIVCRIYQYTERKSYITIESISPENGFASSSENGYGNFYVLRSFSDKIIEDAKRMLSGEEIDSTTKY